MSIKRCLSAAFLWSLGWSGGSFASDKLFLRNGEVIVSPKISANDLGYHYVEGAESRFVGKEKVAFFVSPAKKRGSAHAFDDSAAFGALLPTAPYGEQYLKDLASATRSLDIFTYFVSDTDSPSVAHIVEALTGAVKRKVAVRIILSNDPGTNFGVRQSNLEFAKQVSKEGIAVRLSNSKQLMHKKGAIIDGTILYVGSSNISYYALVAGDNMNARVKNCPNALQNASVMFNRLWEECQPPK